MACTKERASEMNEFAIGELDEGKVEDLLNHILTCKSCAADFDLVADILSCQEEFGAGIFEAEKSLLARLVDRLHTVLQACFFAALATVILPFKVLMTPVPLWRKSAAILVPIALILILAFVVIKPHLELQHELQLLAFVEPDPYRGVVLRDGHEEYQKFFQEGMKSYNEQEYGDAIEKLSQSLALNPEYTAATFYLGVSYLMENRVKQSIAYFQKTVSLTQNPSLLHKSSWYLANAYLKQGDGDKAVTEVEKTAASNGHYRIRAERLLENVRKTME